MYNNIYITKQKEDGTKLEIRIYFYNGKFRIEDVGVKPKGKRKFTYVGGSSLTNDYSYRVLDTEGRERMKMEKILEVCPLEMLNEALIEAWESLKPELINTI